MSNPMFKGGFGSCGLYHINYNPKGECSYCMVAQLQEENRFRERQQKRCQARLKELLEENKKLHLDTRVNDMGMEIGNLKRTIEAREAAMRDAAGYVVDLIKAVQAKRRISVEELELINSTLRAQLEKS